MTPSPRDGEGGPGKADGRTAVPLVPTMGSKLTKSQMDKLKNLSQEFAAIAREGKKSPATSATLAEPSEHHSEAAKVASGGPSSKGRPSQAETKRS